MYVPVRDLAGQYRQRYNLEGSVTWNDKSKSASVMFRYPDAVLTSSDTARQFSRSFAVGENGSYIKNSTLYVDDAYFYQKFGPNFVEKGLEVWGDKVEDYAEVAVTAAIVYGAYKGSGIGSAPNQSATQSAATGPYIKMDLEFFGNKADIKMVKSLLAQCCCA